MTEKKTLREWREELGITVEEVAHHMQVTERTVMLLEHSGQTYAGFDVEWGVPLSETYGFEKFFWLEPAEAIREWEEALRLLDGFTDFACNTLNQQALITILGDAGTRAREELRGCRALYDAYTSWCDEYREKPEKQQSFGPRLTERGFESYKITAGPDKDRKAWRGIGLRADVGGPDDDGTGGKAGQKAENTLHSGHSADESPLSESGLGIAKTTNERRSSGQSGPKSDINSSENAHEGIIPKQGPLRSLHPLDADEEHGYEAKHCPHIPDSVCLSCQGREYE